MIVSNEDGIAVNRPSTVNDIKIAKYKNTKKYGNSDSNGTTFEKKPNQLITILGNEVIIKLHDLFLNEGGIKLRDNLSHGEYDIHSFPTTVDNTMIFIWYIVLAKLNNYFYNENKEFFVQAKECLELPPTFHPIAMLNKQLQTERELLQCTMKYFNDFDYSSDVFDDYRSTNENNFITNELREIESTICNACKNDTILPLFGNP